MKTRKLLALIMTMALALSLFACGVSETGKDTPPFSKVSLDCSEDDVVKAYGECSNISTNDQGGNVYTYLSDYKGKDGAVYISFGADEKPISIQWISLPKTSDEYTELCNSLTSDLNKQYGDAYFTNETAEATVWKDDNKAVTLFTISSDDSYTVSVNYAAKSAEEIAEAFRTDDANAAAELEAKSKIYRKGETAETANYKLTVDTVDIRKRQAEGLEVARAHGVKMGRPTKKYPDNWQDVYVRWKQNKITAVDAMRELNLTKPTFYGLVKRYDGKA